MHQHTTVKTKAVVCEVDCDDAAGWLLAFSLGGISVKLMTEVGSVTTVRNFFSARLLHATIQQETFSHALVQLFFCR